MRIETVLLAISIAAVVYVVAIEVKRLSPPSALIRVNRRIDSAELDWWA